MPTGVYERTEYHQEICRQNGRKMTMHTEEAKKNIILHHRRCQTKEACKKIGEGHKGMVHSKKTREIIKQKTLKQFENGMPEKTKKSISESNKGEKHYNYKGGITPENRRIRRGIETRLWRESVFARDNFTCQKCRERGGKLHPHHIKNFADYPELRFAIDNGITFCKDCHIEFHKKYGYKNNTKEQLEEFIKGGKR